VNGTAKYGQCEKEEKFSFLKKRTKKLLSVAGAAGRKGKSFLLLFCKKEDLPFAHWRTHPKRLSPADD
jgi:hypothetical protein